MEDAVKAGNMPAAQAAMSSWRLDTQNIQKMTGNTGNTNVGGVSGVGNPFQNDLNSLTSAIQSGNSGAAQSSLAKLGVDRQNVAVSTGQTGQAPSEFLNDLQAMLQSVQAAHPSASQQTSVNAASASAGTNPWNLQSNSLQNSNGILGNLLQSANSGGNPASASNAQAAYLAMLGPQAGALFQSMA